MSLAIWKASIQFLVQKSLNGIAFCKIQGIPAIVTYLPWCIVLILDPIFANAPFEQKMLRTSKMIKIGQKKVT